VGEEGLLEETAFATLGSLASIAKASDSACAAVAALLSTLAAGCPPRDVLPLALEALHQTNSDEDNGQLTRMYQAALLDACCTLLSRVPKKRWQCALSASTTVVAVAEAAAQDIGAAPLPTPEAPAAVMIAALRFTETATAAAEAPHQAQLQRLLLTVLATARFFPGGATHLRFASLVALLASNGLPAGAWKALDAAAKARPTESSSDDDDDEPGSDRLTVGAALLAHAWVATSGGVGDMPAAPYAIVLLSGEAGSECSLLGAEIASTACAAPCADAILDKALLSALAWSLGHSSNSSPEARTAVHASLLKCLDVLPPWTRLAALRSLLLEGMAPPETSALLFAYLQAQASLAWPASPLGNAPAVRLVSDWLRVASKRMPDSRSANADSCIGALNVLRALLLRSSASRADNSAWNVALLLQEILAPLCLHAQASASDLASSSDVGAMLAAQTLQEVAQRTVDAAEKCLLQGR